MEMNLKRNVTAIGFILTFILTISICTPAFAANQLPAPAGPVWGEGLNISWNSVENAAGYEVAIYCGSRKANSVTVKTTELDLTKHVGYGGTYKVRVVALGDGTNYTDSAFSSFSEDKILRGDTAVKYDVYVDAQNGDDFGAGTMEDPYRTIERAQGYVSMAASLVNFDVNVNLRGTFYYGEDELSRFVTSRTSNIKNRGGSVVDSYEIQSAVRIGSGDKLRNGKQTIYKNWDGYEATLSGGKRIGGWQLYDSEKNIWKANVGTDKRAREARQLYINGNRAMRARSASIPEGALFSDKTQYVGKDLGMQNWEHLDDVEFVYYRKWCSYRVGVQSVASEGDKYVVNFDPHAWDFATNPHSSKTEITLTDDLEYIENAYELLDTEGEFYINRHTGDVFYMPEPGEDMTKATAVVPVIDELLVIEGDSLTNRAENVTFDGIHFTETTWLRPNGAMGHLSNQSDVSRHEGKLYEAAVRAQTVNNVNFQNCVVNNTGNMGILYLKQFQNCTLIGNVVRDTSGVGVVLGDPSQGYGGNKDYAADPANANEGNLVSNNYIHNIGLDFPSATGFVGGMLRNTKITHNEISSCTYSGISVGWHSGADQVEVGNEISYNLIKDVLTAGIDDGGQIYHLGPTAGDETTPGWLIKENHLVNTYGSVSPMYADNSSSWLTFERNVESTRYSVNDDQIRAGYAQGGGNISKNILFKDNFFTNGRFRDSATNTWIEGDRKTLYNEYVGNKKYPNESWPQEALAIINKAGLESRYKDIKTDKVNLITDGSFEHTKTNYAMPWKAAQAKITRNSSERTDGFYSGRVEMTGSSGTISQTFRMDTSKSYDIRIKAKGDGVSTHLTGVLTVGGKSAIVLDGDVIPDSFTMIGSHLRASSDEQVFEDVTLTIRFSSLLNGDAVYLEECSVIEAGQDKIVMNIDTVNSKATVEYSGATENNSVVASLAVYNPQGSLTDILWNTETIREGSSEIWEYPFPENTHSGDTLKLFLWDAISLKPFVPYETVIIP